MFFLPVFVYAASTHDEMVFNDLVAVVTVALFAASNGYLATVALQCAPAKVRRVCRSLMASARMERLTHFVRVVLAGPCVRKGVHWVLYDAVPSVWQLHGHDCGVGAGPYACTRVSCLSGAQPGWRALSDSVQNTK